MVRSSASLVQDIHQRLAAGGELRGLGLSLRQQRELERVRSRVKYSRGSGREQLARIDQALRETALQRYKVSIPHYDWYVWTMAHSAAQAVRNALKRLEKERPHLKGQIFYNKWVSHADEYAKLVEERGTMRDELLSEQEAAIHSACEYYGVDPDQEGMGNCSKFGQSVRGVDPACADFSNRNKAAAESEKEAELVTPTTSDILKAIERRVARGSSCSLADVASELGVERSKAQKLIHALVKRGYVSQAEKPEAAVTDAEAKAAADADFEAQRIEGERRFGMRLESEKPLSEQHISGDAPSSAWIRKAVATHRGLRTQEIIIDAVTGIRDTEYEKDGIAVRYFVDHARDAFRISPANRPSYQEGPYHAELWKIGKQWRIKDGQPTRSEAATDAMVDRLLEG